MIIPARFFDAVWLHLARLDLMHDDYHGLSTPLILCIEGQPGVGKSYQLAGTLRQLNCVYVRVDASDFGGEFENEPVRRLQSALDTLMDSHKDGLPRPALVIDDLDVSLGRFSSLTQNTINTQLTTGWLMSLADRISDPTFSSSFPAIFVTGNNLGLVHQPLLRSGRARLFEYEPTGEETAAVLNPILMSLGLDNISKDLCRYSNMTLADILEAVSRSVDVMTASTYQRKLPVNSNERPKQSGLTRSVLTELKSMSRAKKARRLIR